MQVTLNAGISDGSIDSISKVVSVTSLQAIGKGSISLTASQANKQVQEAFIDTTLLGILMVCDQDCHVYTNAASGGSPDDTFALKAGIPFFWQKNSGITNPFTSPVTSFYITNDTSTAATFQYMVVKP